MPCRHAAAWNPVVNHVGGPEIGTLDLLEIDRSRQIPPAVRTISSTVLSVTANTVCIENALSGEQQGVLCRPLLSGTQFGVFASEST
jgi:hypothetical protein